MILIGDDSFVDSITKIKKLSDVIEKMKETGDNYVYKTTSFIVSRSCELVNYRYYEHVRKIAGIQVESWHECYYRINTKIDYFDDSEIYASWQ